VALLVLVLLVVLSAPAHGASIRAGCCCPQGLTGQPDGTNVNAAG
jgi:hypothetical protein